MFIIVIFICCFFFKHEFECEKIDDDGHYYFCWGFWTSGWLSLFIHRCHINPLNWKMWCSSWGRNTISWNTNFRRFWKEANGEKMWKCTSRWFGRLLSRSERVDDFIRNYSLQLNSLILQRARQKSPKTSTTIPRHLVKATNTTPFNWLIHTTPKCRLAAMSYRHKCFPSTVSVCACLFVFCILFDVFVWATTAFGLSMIESFVRICCCSWLVIQFSTLEHNSAVK